MKQLIGEDMSDMVYLEYNLKVCRGDASVECMGLLSQVMEYYKDLPPKERDAVSHWFITRYRDGSHDKCFAEDNQ